jgi:hypothetical protein
MQQDENDEQDTRDHEEDRQGDDQDGRHEITPP